MQTQTVLRSRQAVVLVQTITIFSPTDKVKAVCVYVAKLSRRLKDRFVLVGGAAMLFLGSQRITKDVDTTFVPGSEDGLWTLAPKCFTGPSLQAENVTLPSRFRRHR
ncbi:hypothetical protein FQN55_004805 [Onygenales sp. PD_40]|nr:hypothetical protein FQN55_004805 [Onygenales sp. PD_40]